MTLIQVGDSSGVVGRCDAKCYGAQEPHCDCVCNGMNHGKGLQTAIEQTAEYAKEMVKEYTDRKGLKNFETLINHDILQQMRLL